MWGTAPARRMARSDARRGHGSHLDLSPDRRRGALRARGGLLPDRAVQLPVHAQATSPVEPRLHPERHPALERRADRAVPAIGGGRGAVGRHRGLARFPDRAAAADHRVAEPVAAARVFHRRSRDPGAAPDRSDPAPRVRAHAREPACIFRAAPRERILFSGSRVVRVVLAARLPDLRERTLDHEPRIAGRRHRRPVLHSQCALDADLRAVALAAGQCAGAVAFGGAAVRHRGRNNRRHERRFLGPGYRAHAPAGRRACGRPDARDVDLARVGPGGDVGRAGHGARHCARRAAMPAAEYGATRGSMTACGSAALLLLLLAVYSPSSEAQAAAQGLLQRADAAYSSGNRELAKSLYRAVLASDPDNSRAAFQLARLSPPASAEAVALLRRYVKLEPGDPWGNMALGDALAKAGKVDEAIEQYGLARRKAPAESDVYVGLGRILRGAGRTDELVMNYEEWTSRQPKNAEAWSELGRARQRAKRYVEAADAYAA